MHIVDELYLVCHASQQITSLAMPTYDGNLYEVH